ncbi:hypothetical protein T492DRAFT_1139197 [Pavlovales sp. CCMP2436]|nr:hypothetical protein T492DRAFT_1139197 [Pavlovales sp. CCMP2436]
MAAKLLAGKGFVEVRRALLKPERRAGYLAALASEAPLLRSSRPGLLASFVSELGADTNEIPEMLTPVISLHAHASFDERDARESTRNASIAYARLTNIEREAMLSERSEVFVEALECTNAAGADPLGVAAFAPGKPFPGTVYEWREYQKLPAACARLENRYLTFSIQPASRYDPYVGDVSLYEWREYQKSELSGYFALRQSQRPLILNKPRPLSNLYVDL